MNRHYIAVFMVVALMCPASCSRKSAPKDHAESQSPMQEPVQRDSPEFLGGTNISPHQQFSALGWRGPVVKIISDRELDFKVDGTTYVCSYSVLEGLLRVVITVAGTPKLLSFKPAPEGLVSIDDAQILYSPLWLETAVVGKWTSKVIYKVPDGSEVEQHVLTERSLDHSSRWERIELHHGKREYYTLRGKGVWKIEGVLLREGSDLNDETTKFAILQIDQAALSFEAAVGGERFRDLRVGSDARLPGSEAGYKEVDEKGRQLWGELAPTASLR